ncbi:MAG: site-specific tyrosine recombinase XerD [Bacteroidia bacterium]|nr:site-specific tyrosine recombinase XerD [Bacteroidia bacterium]
MSQDWARLAQMFSRYLTLERSLSANSIEAYTSDIQKLQQWCELQLGGASPVLINSNQLQDFSAWLAEIGFSAISQARIISGVRSFYKFLLLEGIIQENPADFLEPPKTGRKLPVVLSAEEIDVMIASIDRTEPSGERDVAMLEVLYSCGLRVSELVGLRTTDLYLDEQYMRVIGKGNKERLVPIGNRALKHLKIYRNEIRVHLNISPLYRDIVFLNLRGGKLSRQSIFLLIKKLALRTGIKKNISPHTFRHSFATHLVEAGADLRAVQEMLGHESITTTEIYTHLDRNYLADTLVKFHPRSY